MLAEYSSSIKPEHERAEHVLRLQNQSTSTKQAPSEHVLGPIPNTTVKFFQPKPNPH